VEPKRRAAHTRARDADRPGGRLAAAASGTPARYRAPGPAQACACYGRPILDRRLHVLLDEDRFERLARLADERGVSVGSLVRRAIDVAYPAGGLRRSAAAAAILEARAGPSPKLDDLRAELDELRRRAAPEPARSEPPLRRGRRATG